jgi:hypothetical protein
MSEHKGVLGKQAERSQGIPSAALWFGVLGGPAAWSAQVLLNYNAEDLVACSPATQVPATILGVSATVVVQLVNLVCALATLVAGIVAFIAWRRLKPRSSSSLADRPEWMARAGIMVSILFFVMIGMGFAGPLLLETCQRSP